MLRLRGTLTFVSSLVNCWRKQHLLMLFPLRSISFRLPENKAAYSSFYLLGVPICTITTAACSAASMPLRPNTHTHLQVSQHHQGYLERYHFSCQIAGLWMKARSVAIFPWNKGAHCEWIGFLAPRPLCGQHVGKLHHKHELGAQGLGPGHQALYRQNVFTPQTEGQ